MRSNRDSSFRFVFTFGGGIRLIIFVRFALKQQGASTSQEGGSRHDSASSQGNRSSVSEMVPTSPETPDSSTIKQVEGFICPLCMITFPTADLLVEHFSSNHADTYRSPNGVDSVQCPHCKMLFPGNKELSGHIEMHHLPKAEAKEQPLKVVVFDEDSKNQLLQLVQQMANEDKSQAKDSLEQFNNLFNTFTQKVVQLEQQKSELEANLGDTLKTLEEKAFDVLQKEQELVDMRAVAEIHQRDIEDNISKFIDLQNRYEVQMMNNQSTYKEFNSARAELNRLRMSNENFCKVNDQNLALKSAVSCVGQLVKHLRLISFS